MIVHKNVSFLQDKSLCRAAALQLGPQNIPYSMVGSLAAMGWF